MPRGPPSGFEWDANGRLFYYSALKALTRCARLSFETIIAPLASNEIVIPKFTPTPPPNPDPGRATHLGTGL